MGKRESIVKLTLTDKISSLREYIGHASEDAAKFQAHADSERQGIAEAEAEIADIEVALTRLGLRESVDG